jgi:hypothetical protein
MMMMMMMTVVVIMMIGRKQVAAKQFDLLMKMFLE